MRITVSAMILALQHWRLSKFDSIHSAVRTTLSIPACSQVANTEKKRSGNVSPDRRAKAEKASTSAQTKMYTKSCARFGVHFRLAHLLELRALFWGRGTEEHMPFTTSKSYGRY